MILGTVFRYILKFMMFSSYFGDEMCKFIYLFLSDLVCNGINLRRIVLLKSIEFPFVID